MDSHFILVSLALFVLGFASGCEKKKTQMIRLTPQAPGAPFAKLEFALDNDGKVKPGRTRAIIVESNGKTSEREFVVREVKQDFVMEPWPEAQDIGFSVRFRKPDPQGQWADGTLWETTDEGDSNLGAVRIETFANP